MPRQRPWPQFSLFCSLLLLLFSTLIRLQKYTIIIIKNRWLDVRKATNNLNGTGKRRNNKLNDYKPAYGSHIPRPKDNKTFTIL